MELQKAKEWIGEDEKKKPDNLVQFLTHWLHRAFHREQKKALQKFPWQRTIEDLESPYCEACSGDGFRQAIRRTDKALVTLRCNCEAGTKAQSSLPFYNSRDWIAL